MAFNLRKSKIFRLRHIVAKKPRFRRQPFADDRQYLRRMRKPMRDSHTEHRREGALRELNGAVHGLVEQQLNNPRRERATQHGDQMGLSGKYSLRDRRQPASGDGVAG